MSEVIYICDKHACRKCNENNKKNYCKHTSKLEHAINKDKVYGYFELYSSGDRTVLVELSNKDRERRRKDEKKRKD